MSSTKLSVNKVEFCVSVADLIEHHPAFRVISDERFMYIPEDRLDDFCFDVGIFVKRIIKKIAKPQENMDK